VLANVVTLVKTKKNTEAYDFKMITNFFLVSYVNYYACIDKSECIYQI